MKPDKRAVLLCRKSTQCRKKSALSEIRTRDLLCIRHNALPLSYTVLVEQVEIQIFKLTT